MFKLIFENKFFLIVDKDPGVDFHNDDNELGLFNQVKQWLDTNSLYPVHRLDKVTSGLIVFAKDADTAAKFHTMFKNKSIQKFYLAVSNKKPIKKQGTIKGDMARSRRSSWKLVQCCNNPAVTQFFSYSFHNSLRLFLIKPLTGKTHQIRVALKSIGAPIIGDPIYYSAEKNEWDRTYLHAYAVKFALNGEEYSFVSPPAHGSVFQSDEMIKFTDDNTAPWKLNWPKYKFPSSCD